MKEKSKYLTFVLKNENYGIPINVVKEIIAMLPITEVPKTPNFIKGVINLRGKVISIMDLRLKLGLEEKSYDERTCIIVVDINTSEISKQMGIAVDIVAEVIDIHESQIQEISKEEIQIDGEFIKGMAKVKDRVISLLDIEKILTKNKLQNL
ncbi:purine-binding chemotaxis protein CheW [Hypnocyclicus thermotrophus]|uniref:Purine-binding chemotaxis protein CheW n=1 Tax=Hypnocyclicus thermotrophus TaxID=1627895 RepID=A0AA46E027_9FUSO|nr:chemotaxis protein CheW [Hypnocyclicus thermotrophus]TDT72334.1 purine-binding chemotaxis protein CheW [Hypnocyclicus thermotrophus]